MCHTRNKEPLLVLCGPPAHPLPARAGKADVRFAGELLQAHGARAGAEARARARAKARARARASYRARSHLGAACRHTGQVVQLSTLCSAASMRHRRWARPAEPPVHGEACTCEQQHEICLGTCLLLWGSRPCVAYGKRIPSGGEAGTSGFPRSRPSRFQQAQ